MTLPAEFTSSRHTFIPDEFNEGATCRRCGEAFSFGALHVEPPVDITDDSLPRLCSCGHYTHRNECWGGVPSYPKPKPCECKERAK